MTEPAAWTIGIVNRFAPPDRAPTATAAAALARDLAAALPRARLTLYASAAVYASGAGAGEAPPDGDGDGTTDAGVAVVRLPSLYGGRWPPARLAASLIEGHALARRAARDCQLVISLTDPPLLSLWQAAACRRRHRRWIEWSLDRYPDVLAAAGLIGSDHPVFRWLVRRDAGLCPDALIGLGPGQLAALAGRRTNPAPALWLPVGLVSRPARPLGDPDADPNPGTAAPLTVAYAGTLGHAHDPTALTALIGRADPARFRFALAITGHHAAALHRQLAGHPAVHWHARLDPADLAGAAAHLVVLAGAATHLCVPSKAVSAVSMGRPFLFAGRPDADTWQQLGSAGWLIPQARDGGWRDADIDAALTALADPAQRRQRAAAARHLTTQLQQQRRRTIAALATLIGQMLPP